MLRIEARFVPGLLKQPESGMGFQRVEVTREDGGTAFGVVFNAELLALDAEKTETMTARSFGIAAAAAHTTAGRIGSIRVIGGSSRYASVRERSATSSYVGEAKDAPIEQTKTGDVFKRFSAYENDRRVQPDGSLLPGTFATTKEDARNVRTGRDAVSRYSLPNPEPASWVFTSAPESGTSIRRGIAAPANGQPGGGVEVIFEDGTQPATTTGPERIPD